MTTLKDIAKIANVSEAAVSMALRGKKGVSKETAQKILAIADSLNYHPNPLAQGLSKGQTKTIGLVVPDMENPYYANLVQCMLKEALQLGYHLSLGVSNENPALERQVIERFLAARVDGIAIAPVNILHSQTEYLEQHYQSGVPIVFISNSYSNTRIPAVMADLEEGTYQLVTYLLQSGYRNIYHLTGDPQILCYARRIEGFHRAYTEAALPCSAELTVPCKYVTFEGAYHTVLPLLSQVQTIDAIITSNDIMALGVLRALQERNIRVPDEIAVAGFDNTLFSTIGSLPLTTVSQNMLQLCRNTLELLLRQLDGGEIGTVPLIAPELIIRKTTGTRAVSH